MDNTTWTPLLPHLGRHTPLRHVSQGSLVGIRHFQYFLDQWAKHGTLGVCDETKQMLINMNGARLHLRRVGQLVHHFAGYLQAVILR